MLSLPLFRPRLHSCAGTCRCAPSRTHASQKSAWTCARISTVHPSLRFCGWPDHIERFFDKLKRVPARCHLIRKLLVNFMGYVKLAAIGIWLR